MAIGDSMNNSQLIKSLKKRFSQSPPDLTNPEVCNEFCRKYGEVIRPELEKIDQMQARSLGIAITRVVR